MQSPRPRPLLWTYSFAVVLQRQVAKLAFATASVYTVFGIHCIPMRNIDEIEGFLLRCFAALRSRSGRAGPNELLLLLDVT